MISPAKPKTTRNSLQQVIASHVKERASVAERHAKELGALNAEIEKLRGVASEATKRAEARSAAALLQSGLEAENTRKELERLKTDFEEERKKRVAAESTRTELDGLKTELEVERFAAQDTRNELEGLENEFEEEKKKRFAAEAKNGDLVIELRSKTSAYHEFKAGCAQSRQLVEDAKADVEKSTHQANPQLANGVCMVIEGISKLYPTVDVDTDDEFEYLRSKYITDNRAKAYLDISLLRKCHSIHQNPLGQLHPQFPVSPARLDLVPLADHDITSRLEMDEALDKLKHDSQWSLVPGQMSTFTVLGHVYLGGYSWTFNKLAELSIEPRDADREMFVWLTKLYDHHIVTMNAIDLYGNLRLLAQEEKV
jgi:hypothetical protein